MERTTYRTSKNLFAKELDRQLGALHKANKLRLWSLVVTIFGDSVLPRGGSVAATTLTTITERLGFTSGALRVSLSRLAKEGWISRRKEGRHSFYSLTKEGIAEFDPASDLIYAHASAKDDGKYAFIIPPVTSPGGNNGKFETMTLANGSIELSPGLFVIPENKLHLLSQNLGDCMIIKGSVDQLPQSFASALAPPGLQDEILRAKGDFARMLEALNTDTSPPSDLEAVVSWTLIVHLWRRLVLRQSHIPVALLPSDWPIGECRAAVIALYQQLSPICEPWLQETCGPLRDNKPRFLP